MFYIHSRDFSCASGETDNASTQNNRTDRGGYAAGGGRLASASETITYTYDAKGRLILVTHSGTVNNNVVANYTFDAADNRKNIKVTGAP